MRFSVSFVLLFFIYTCAYQPADDETQLNGMVLGAPRQDFLQDFHFYTGEEPFYKDYPTIRESLLQNIAKGIQEGVYEGEDLLRFGQWQAHGLTLTFYHEKLHKAQWTFKAFEGAEVLKIAQSLGSRFEHAYGAGAVQNYPEFTITVWQGISYQLQTFQEGDLELTVSFQDMREIQ